MIMSKSDDGGIGEIEKTAAALSINQSKAAAACWICLDDLPDQHGNLPVRNCSCRGEDAGFAHISCIIEYAERKGSERHCEFDPQEFVFPWHMCPNCKQHYEGQLAADLADKMISYAEKSYSTFDWRRLSAYQAKLARIDELVRTDETKKLMELSLEICERLLSTPVTAIRIHPADLLSLVASTYETIGISEAICGQRNMREDIFFQGIEYLEKAKEINQQCDNHTQIAQLEANIMFFKSVHEKKKSVPKESNKSAVSKEKVLKMQRKSYLSTVKNRGEVGAIDEGTSYMYALKENKHTIKAWRLATRLLSVSQQYHGREHATTCNLQSLYDLVSTVIVSLKSRKGLFQALRCEGEQYVLQGPVNEPRDPSKETVIHANVNDIIMAHTTDFPVICHGLKNASHLNGKIGDARSYDATEERFCVHFEDPSLLPKCVKAENLRILFDLPPNDEAEI